MSEHTTERITGFALPNSTLDAMTEKIGRFGWPYKQHARAVAIQMLAAALKEGGVVLVDEPPFDQP